MKKRAHSRNFSNTAWDQKKENYANEISMNQSNIQLGLYCRNGDGIGSVSQKLYENDNDQSNTLKDSEEVKIEDP